MKSRDILEKAVALYNEPINDQEIHDYVEQFYGKHIEEIDYAHIYALAYGTAITDLSARLGVDVKAFLDSRGETQVVVNDGEGPSREQVELYTSIYRAGSDDRAKELLEVNENTVEDAEESHRVA